MRRRPRVNSAKWPASFRPKRGGLGVDAVAAADGGRQLVLEGAPLQRVQQRVDLDQDQVGRALELDRQRGVEQVGRGQAEMQESRLRAAHLLDMGQEGDHVVAGRGLDLLDPGRIDQPLAVGGDGGRERADRLGRDGADLRPWPRRRPARRRARCRGGSRARRSPPSRGGCSEGSCAAHEVDDGAGPVLAVGHRPGEGASGRGGVVALAWLCGYLNPSAGVASMLDAGAPRKRWPGAGVAEPDHGCPLDHPERSGRHRR